MLPRQVPASRSSCRPPEPPPSTSRATVTDEGGPERGYINPRMGIDRLGAEMATGAVRGAPKAPLVFDPRVLQLLTFLTRTQAWLTPPEIAKAFRIDRKALAVATLHRWFAALEETAGLVYFPYPWMNRLGLLEVQVRVFGLRSPRHRAVLPRLPRRAGLRRAGCRTSPWTSPNTRSSTSRGRRAPRNTRRRSAAR